MNKEIMTLKDIMEDENLAVHIAEDIDDVPEDLMVSYAVWAIGYDENSEITDTDMFIKEFSDPDAAVDFAKELSLADIIHQAANEYTGQEITENIAYISIEVETVVEDIENNESMNIGTVYKRELWINSDNEEDAFEEEDDDVVSITSEDYELLENGLLKIKCSILKDCNKNDRVQFLFVEENANDMPILLTYKIISKAMYDDGDYYLCDFVH